MWLARVKDLFVYPLKSARAVALQRAQVDARGLQHDRQWLLVDERGRYVTQRTHPRLAVLPAIVCGENLEIGPVGELTKLTVPPPAATAMRRVDIWSHRGMALDCGDAAAAWCSRFLATEVRLVHAGTALDRYANPDKTAGDKVPLAFADGYPILVTNSASLDELGSKMGAALRMDAFRPNIVLADLPPWAEDHIGRIEIGPITLRLCKPCTRCVIPAIDQTTGLPGPDPTPTLKRYRWNKSQLGVTFGENSYVLNGAGAKIDIGMVARCHPRSADDLTLT